MSGEDLSPDEWLELLSEPPGGENHGRSKNANGRWTPLEPVDWAGSHVDYSSASFKRVASQTKHGTIYAYVRLKCRCAKCRATWSAYLKERRGDG